MTSKSLRTTATEYNKTAEIIISRKAWDYLTSVFKKIYFTHDSSYQAKLVFLQFYLPNSLSEFQSLLTLKICTVCQR